MRRFISIVIVLAMLGVAVNDLSRFAKAKSHLAEATIQLAKYATDQAVDKSPEAVAAEIKPMGEPLGVSVYQYAQGDNKVRLWTEAEVTGTIVLGTLVNLASGSSFSEARKAPFKIREFKQAGI